MIPALVQGGAWSGTPRGLPIAATIDRMRRCGAQWRRWWAAELRIDVDLPADDLEDELAQLYERWFMSGAALDALPGIGPSRHGLVFRTRHADGEHFIYVVHPARRVMAAYIVLSRLVEVNRRADRHLRSPHAKVAQAYRRRGIASQVYRWWLASGRSLMSGERQSPQAHGMWMALARDHALVYVQVCDKQVHRLDANAPESVLHALGTRLVLLGKGCDGDQVWAAP